MFKVFFLSAVAATALAAGAAPSFAGVNFITNGTFQGAELSTRPVYIGGQPYPPTFYFAAGTYLCYGADANHTGCTTNFAWRDTNGDTGTPSVNTWIAAPGAPTYYPGFAHTVNGATVYSYPTDAPPGGSNIYVADAQTPRYTNNVYMYETVAGLVAGQTYEVSFYQAAASENLAGVAGEWSQWVVGLSDQAPGPTYAPSDTQDSQQMSMASQNHTDWQLQSLIFTADSATEYLSFQANGAGVPPFALLADVTMYAAPEPSTWAMMGLGFAGLGFAGWRSNRKSSRFAI